MNTMGSYVPPAVHALQPVQYHPAMNCTDVHYKTLHCPAMAGGGCVEAPFESHILRRMQIASLWLSLAGSVEALAG
eukprot:2579228-Amphidinium_carterae.1